MHSIFHHIDKLNYEDVPDYNFIYKQLLQIYNNYEMIQAANTAAPSIKWQSVKRSTPAFKTYEELEQQVMENKSRVFHEYFTRVTSEGQSTPSTVQ
jgi:hypothetical protein